MEIFYQNLKLNPAAKKIQSYRNKWIQRVWRNEHSTALYCEMSTVWETKPRTTPRENSWLLMGPEQVTRHKTLQAIWWWWWWWITSVFNSTVARLLCNWPMLCFFLLTTSLEIAIEGRNMLWLAVWLYTLAPTWCAVFGINIIRFILLHWTWIILKW